MSNNIIMVCIVLIKIQRNRIKDYPNSIKRNEIDIKEEKKNICYIKYPDYPMFAPPPEKM